MTHLYREHIAATYLERSGEISPMCIRDAFPLQVGGTDSAVSPAHNECLTGACWKYKPGNERLNAALQHIEVDTFIVQPP